MIYCWLQPTEPCDFIPHTLALFEIKQYYKCTQGAMLENVRAETVHSIQFLHGDH